MKKSKNGLLIFTFVFFLASTVCTQEINKSALIGENENVDLYISSPNTTFNTKLERLIAENFQMLLKIGLSSQNNWLNIVFDSSAFIKPLTFSLESNIRDFGSYIRINIVLTSNTSSISFKDFRKMYDFSPDSILSNISVISYEVSNKISKALVKEFSKRYHVMLYPFKIDIQGGDTAKVSEYLTQFLEKEINKCYIISNVDHLSDPDTNYFKLTGSLKNNYYNDGYIINGKILNSANNELIYQSSSDIYTYSLTSAAESIVNDLSVFFLVYSDIENTLNEDLSVNQLLKEAENVLADGNAPNAYLKATIFLEKALRLEQENITALNKLGSVELGMENFEKAEVLFNKVLEIDPNNAEASFGLGKMYYYDFQDKKAEKFFMNTIKSSGASEKNYIDSAYYWLGELNSANANYKDAIKNFKEAISINPDNSKAWYGIGKSYYNLYLEEEKPYKDTINIYKSIYYFKKGLERFPQDETFVYNISYTLNYWGRIYYDQSLYESDKYSYYTESCYKKMLEATVYISYDNNLNAQNYSYLAYLEYIYYIGYDKAKEFASKAYNQKPTNEWPNRITGGIIAELKDTSNYNIAKDALQNAIAISETWGAYSYLGKIYFDEKKYDSAFYAYSSALTIDSDKKRHIFYLNQLSESAILYNNYKFYSEVVNFINNELDDPDSEYPKEKAYLYLAKINRKSNGSREEFETYINNIFNTQANPDEVYQLLDSLFRSEADSAAFAMRIKHKEKLYNKESDFDDIWSICLDYISFGDYQKCKKFIDDEKYKILVINDTAEAAYLLGTCNFYLGQQVLSAGDTSSFNNYIEQSVMQLEAARRHFPDWATPLMRLNFIYHEYTFDFNKSYEISLKLKNKDPNNTNYIANYTEALLTVGKFKEAKDYSEKILETDSIGGRNLSNDENLAMRFVYMAAKILNKDLFGAYSDFGDFKRKFIEVEKEGEFTWSWLGTKHYIEKYEDINDIDKSIVLNTLEILENKKNEGINELEEVEKKWRSRILEQ